MLRGLFIRDVEICARLIRTIFRNDNVVVLGGHDTLYVIARSLDWSDVYNQKNEAHYVPL